MSWVTRNDTKVISFVFTLDIERKPKKLDFEHVSICVTRDTDKYHEHSDNLLYYLAYIHRTYNKALLETLIASMQLLFSSGLAQLPDEETISAVLPATEI